jgi:FHS family L-fucose permease-like MFS transporter
MGDLKLMIFWLCSFLSICGPPRYSEIRLNLAQAVQGVGSMVGPLLASYVFFKDIQDTADGLQQVQWTYLGIACFVTLLAVVFFLAPMPEVTDADMALMEAEIGEVEVGSFWKQYVPPTALLYSVSDIQFPINM